MYLAIITLPLLGSIVAGFLGRKIGVSGAQFITCTCVVVTTLLAIVTFFEVGLNNIPVTIYLFKWVDSESFNVFWSFHFDSLTVSMLIPVLIVSSLVHIYSIGYMSHDPHNQRFFSYLSLFTFMMIILVTANNFLLMFVGWEGVGICSYLLVSFWFTRIAANQSSMSAFLTNRVGDCFLTIGMFAILWSFGNLDYSTVFSLAPFVNEDIVTIIGICLFIGAMAKSSQVGLHVWLPMAMEGPTPVSALIHAATMVTAGVYLLMRTSPLIEYSSTVLILCLWLGAITTVFSSLIGLFQQDIKKVIAYSTMSQLGMMVIAVGLSSYNVALFHLVNHAFYKALLFLGAGAVIHAVADNQDFRKYGGLRPFLPLTYSVMLIASLSLVAFPFMTGFYSKDFILESAYGQFYFSGTVVYFIATIGAMFTTLYSVKVLYLTFLTNPNGPIKHYLGSMDSYRSHTGLRIQNMKNHLAFAMEIYKNTQKGIISDANVSSINGVKKRPTYPIFVNKDLAEEGNIYMSLPLMILAIFSIFFGYICKDMFIGLGSGLFADNSIFIHPTHEIMLDTEFAVPTLFKLLPLVFTLSLSILAIFISEFIPNIVIYFKLTKIGYNIFGFFNQRFLIEMFYNKYITNYILKSGGQTTKVLDKGSVELMGPYGLEKALITLSKNIASLNTGVITSYALYILIGLILYVLIPYLAIFNNSFILLILLALLSIVKLVLSDTRPAKTQASVSVPLQSDLGLLLYYILTKKIVTRTLIIFTIGFIFRNIINYFFNVDFSDPLNVIANMHYLFTALILVLTDNFSIFSNLPTIHELYNSIFNRVRLFNFKSDILKLPEITEAQLEIIKSKVEKPQLHSAMNISPGSTGGSGSGSGSGAGAGAGAGSGSGTDLTNITAINSGDKILTKLELDEMAKQHKIFMDKVLNRTITTHEELGLREIQAKFMAHSRSVYDNSVKGKYNINPKDFFSDPLAFLTRNNTATGSSAGPSSARPSSPDLSSPGSSPSPSSPGPSSPGPSSRPSAGDFPPYSPRDFQSPSGSPESAGSYDDFPTYNPSQFESPQRSPAPESPSSVEGKGKGKGKERDI
jgi:NADH-ubiquinone oxidoreductase chain 5